MSTEVKWITDAIPPGNGWALDVGGRKGRLQQVIEEKGYNYVNFDLSPIGKGKTVCGDANALSFDDGVFSLIVSINSIEHFEQPVEVLKEIRRVMKRGGMIVIWVPFMHPFHGDDYYRYTPLALQEMLRDFKIIRFETPLWVFSVMGLAVVEVLKRIRLGSLSWIVKEIGWRIDWLAQRKHPKPRSFAGAYLVVAEKT
jgi:SAM-dependent methyltransferase